MSVRIQQILQHETNIGAVTDPLGGSYYVEALTAEMAERASGFAAQIAAHGGFLATLDSGWLHARARDNQVAWMAAEEEGRQKVVGVTDFRDDHTPFEVDGFPGVNDAYDVAKTRLDDVRRERHEAGAHAALEALEQACRGTDNIMPRMLDALEAEVTLGEIGDLYRSVSGRLADSGARVNDPNPRRVLLAKTFLDGHWRGLSVVARALRDGGFHVIMGGMLTGQEIVRAAVDEDVDLVGLNVGGHVEVVVRVIGELRAARPDLPHLCRRRAAAVELPSPR
jgi:hypothetical protein